MVPGSAIPAVVTRRYVGVATLPDIYDRLFARGGARSFFLTRSWFVNFERTILRQDEEVVIYGVETAWPLRRALAALPLRRTLGHGRPLQPRTLGSLSNFYTCFYEPLVAPEAADLAFLLDRLVMALRDDAGQWDVLDLRPLPAEPESELLPQLIHALAGHGFLVQPYFCFGNWFLTLSGRSYDEYFRGLPSILRKNIPYCVRRIEKTHGLRVEIRTEPAQLEQALVKFEALYLARWGRMEPFPGFVPGLAATAAADGALRLGLLFVGDEPAAAQLWFVSERIASIYKTAYDPRFARYSVGSVLTSSLMRHVIDVDKVSEVDYLAGDDAYKSLWMPSRRERWGVMAFNPRRVLGIAGAVRHIGLARIKKSLRRMLPGVGGQSMPLAERFGLGDPAKGRAAAPQATR